MAVSRGSYRALQLVVISVFSLAALGGFALVVTRDPAAGLSLAVPGADGKPPLPAVTGGPAQIGEFFRRSDGAPSSLGSAWPRFRGSAMDGVSAERVALGVPGAAWQPAVLWSAQMGEGHAGAAVAGGRVYVLDYDERRQADALRCLSLDDGREIWRRWYTVRLKRNHGISRTIPAVDGRHVVSLGPACHLMCCNAATGELLWGVDLPALFEAEVPLWYTGQCPLIDGGQAVVAPGGKAILAGIDVESGRVAWETPNPRKLPMSHSSVMVMELAGKRTYVYAAVGGIVGVSAERADRGRLLWECRDFDATVIAPSPVAVGRDRVFVTAGYGAGSILLAVSREGDSFAVKVVSKNRPAEGFACEHQTPLLIQGKLLGILPKDAGKRRAELACWEPGGGCLWSSGQENRFGLGPYIAADGKLLILDEDGTLTVAEASTRAYRPLGSARILDGPDAWAPLALVAGRLIARDTRRMVCIDMRAGGTP